MCQFLGPLKRLQKIVVSNAINKINKNAKTDPKDMPSKVLWLSNCAVGPGLCVDVVKVVNQIGVKVDFSIVLETVDEVLEDVNITFCLGVAVLDNLLIRSTAIEVVVIDQLWTGFVVLKKLSAVNWFRPVISTPEIKKLVKSNLFLTSWNYLSPYYSTLILVLGWKGSQTKKI